MNLKRPHIWDRLCVNMRALALVNPPKERLTITKGLRDREKLSELFLRLEFKSLMDTVDTFT